MQDLSHRTPVQYFLASLLVENDPRTTSEIRRKAFLRNINKNIQDIPSNQFIQRFRLNKQAFSYLCSLLKRRTALKDTNRISLEQKVLCALSFYASGSYQRLVGMALNVGQTTVSKYINEVTEALISPQILDIFIRFPKTRQERDTIKNKFYSKYGIPGVIGCVDGSQFRIFTPKRTVEHLYYCRKHFHSLNVQMVCDSDCRILNVNAKYGGPTHDSFIWEYSQVNSYMQDLHRNHNEQVWLLGDSGYPQRPWLMTPIPDATEGSPEAKYTGIHGKARVTIENTFGRLKNRWRCLNKDRTLHYAPDKCAKIILACSVLHNLCLHFNIPNESEDILEQRVSFSTPFVDNEPNDELIAGRAMRYMLVQKIHTLHR